MGTSSILDIITSAILAGVLLLIALRLNAQSNESTMQYNSSVILQQNITTVVGWIEHDFRQIGYCRDYKKVPIPSRAFRDARDTTITFWTDINTDGHPPDGSLDSIKWYLGASNDSIVKYTDNPRDRLIYRVVNNGTPVGWNLGVTQFSLAYYDFMRNRLSTPVTSPDLIYEIQITIKCESPFIPKQSTYTAAKGNDTSDYQVFWRQIRLAARNLKNR
jgi:hypothetical protein